MVLTMIIFAALLLMYFQSLKPVGPKFTITLEYGNRETKAPETKAPATKAPETKAPETRAPETKAPETKAPQTKAPETKAPETKAPETRAPETQAPETRAPETKAPETQAPETQAPETSAPVVQAPETQAPETSAPVVQAPEAQAPEISAPVVQAPEAQAPEISAPVIQAPETQAPETQAPEPSYVYEDNIISGEVPDAPEAAYCASQDQIYPGNVYNTTADTSSLVWVPSTGCKLHHFNPTEAATCLSGKKIAFFGDSLLDDTAHAIVLRANGRYEWPSTEDVKGRWWKARPNRECFLAGQETPFLEFFWTNSAFYNDPTDPSREKASFAIRNADVVLLNNAMWDIGDSCQGVYAFYHAMKARIEKVQSVVKPGAMLVLYDLPYIWTKKVCTPRPDGEGSNCHVHNQPKERVALYRTALRLAAACTGVRFLSDFEMTKHIPSHTNDGVHFSTFEARYMKADVFLNGICTRGGQAPMEFTVYPKASCNVTQHFIDWENNPLAGSCPRRANPYVPETSAPPKAPETQAPELNYVYEDNIITGEVPDAPEAAYCASQDQIYPGNVYNTTADTSSLVWVPSTGCKLHHFNPTEAATCLSGKKIAFFGDSLLDDTAHALALRPNGRYEWPSTEDVEGRWWKARPNRECFLEGQETPFLEFFWTNSAFYNDPTDPSREKASFAIRNADVVVLNNAMWDIGDSCQGVYAFYHAMKGRIEKVQRVIKPGAMLVLYDLPYLWTKKVCTPKPDGEGSNCHVHNEPKSRVAEYRTALRLAAACTGVRVLSDFEMTKHIPSHTSDGVHFQTFEARYMKADVFLNGICTRGGQAPMEFTVYPKEKCDVTQHFIDWENSPTAEICYRRPNPWK